VTGFEELPTDPSLADPMPPSPLPLLERWLAEARARRVQRNPTAMVLATADADGTPSARVVLCRGFDPERGFLVFYSNRESAKGADLSARPRAAAVFHWDALERQARVAGPVGLSPDAESDAYFAGRPRLSQLAAWASEQSRSVASRRELLELLDRSARRFEGEPVPRPPFWGGYRLHAERVELWVGSRGRAHDRGLWTRELRDDGAGGLRGGPWSVRRLQP